MQRLPWGDGLPESKLKKGGAWDFLGGPVVKTLCPLQGTGVPSLVSEQRSHMPHGVAKR